MRDFDELVRGLKERAKNARAEGNMTATCDAMYFDDAACAIERLRTPQWQPIETAPKGDVLICYEEGGATFGMFDTYAGEWRTGDDFHYRFYPTHWMPFPEAPK